MKGMRDTIKRPASKLNMLHLVDQRTASLTVLHRLKRLKVKRRQRKSNAVTSGVRGIGRIQWSVTMVALLVRRLAAVDTATENIHTTAMRMRRNTLPLVVITFRDWA